ncbi:glycoside hydrolase family 3 protein [Catelliglobosispora koreensis]|uniref:glycoside hydrolase family 3 protein n=1 Tax=Catelliglobosispora koreensis TaxID=129052 RepID=UPI000371B244|nr:glycoside hydrolase family 3 N-terminal domain-containing protein [Catelliglobosispora koreensis]
MSIDSKVSELLAKMTLEEKAGMLFHTMIMMGDGSAMGVESNEDMVLGKHMNHFNLFGSASAAEMATWYNNLQDLAKQTRLGIPVTISTDPRHHFSDNPFSSMLSGPFSQWPEPTGLAATRDAELVERFADIARQEYLAAGIRVSLHPQIDLATEPRWARINHTFGEDAALTSELVRAYIRGFQGETLGAHSVSTMTKHFPGGGPQLDGEDPHFPYGREQVYPGGQFDYHLQPFLAALEAGGSQIMPYYGMPVGTAYEEVGFGFNKAILTGLLREKLGFDGIICTDWGLVTDAEVFGQTFHARAWGVEHLSRLDRVHKIVEAGADQLGGEACPDLIVELVKAGRITEERLNTSVARLLREKFALGLFDNPYVDVAKAEETIGRQDFMAAGFEAQKASLTLLKNEGVLPLRAQNVYGEGIDGSVDSPEEAEVAIIRLKAPFEPREGALESFFHAGTLEFPEEIVEHVAAVAAKCPVVLDIYLDRPAILTPLVPHAAAIIVNYGAQEEALKDVLFGRSSPKGKLPFDLPSSMQAVTESRSDVAFDTKDPLYAFGFGLTY